MLLSQCVPVLQGPNPPRGAPLRQWYLPPARLCWPKGDFDIRINVGGNRNIRRVFFVHFVQERTGMAMCSKKTTCWLSNAS